MTASPPTPTRTLTIPGPAGTLEALLDEPTTVSSPEALAVVCHPHPLYGGTMTNKVVYSLAKAFNEAGATAVRFNYRGVGASTGSYDDGNGETADAQAVLDWAAERWSGARLYLAGFSFGGAVAIRAAATRNVTRLVTIAPAIRRVSVDTGSLPQCPWLIVQGDRDELVDPNDIRQWAQELPESPRLVMLEGVEHFFHGRLNDLRQTVVRWLIELAQLGR
ncbi:alpha/beta fold hydrolase [Steroidobacter sp. S1-65]|uniref:Alpha/beta fold hydrolase n=1 Tax=Steroidobacter gossypii TaxID=2805490 RepID=A0ABS1X311_9GAMM|nr:alpha/beta fold hydrolase [Steroidobacter gossypii]MBM0107612.1 alpha/beta fold hydrolase [Steroidobacter gossypii]